MNLKLLLIATTLVLSFSSLVNAECLEDCQHKKSLSSFKKTVLEDSPVGSSDEGCPEGGSKISEEGSSRTGSLLSAESSLRKIAADLIPLGKKLRADKSKCGSCEQVNLVTLSSVSRPQTEGTDEVCSAKGTYSVDGDFSDADDAQKFIKSTLDGDNSEGNQLYRACDDPCSFYVYQGQSILPNGKNRVHMNVRCGQPRGSMFAKYKFSGALVHEWACKKN